MARWLLILASVTSLVIAVTCAGAQTRSSDFVGTGDLRTDLFGFTELQGLSHSWHGDSTLAPATERKSPILAAGLSLVVPGAGEFYSGTYWKAALFFAAEAALWSLAYSYNKRGDRGTDAFNTFADTHWSVVRYIDYTLKNLVPSGSQYNLWKSGGPPPSTVPDPWDYVNWSELNRMEHDVSATSEGSFYSHTLPVHGDQQYYEEIGKYEQFNSGWDDVSPNLPPDYATIKANESANALSYTYQRAQANGFYTKAATFVAVALVNHLVSAIDAAFSASAYNHAIRAEVGVQTVPDGLGSVSVPVVTILVNF